VADFTWKNPFKLVIVIAGRAMNWRQPVFVSFFSKMMNITGHKTDHRLLFIPSTAAYYFAFRLQR
jgi:hypothetical protein